MKQINFKLHSVCGEMLHPLCHYPTTWAFNLWSIVSFNNNNIVLNFSIPGFVFVKLEEDLFKTMNWLAIVLWWQNAIRVVLLRVFGFGVQELLTDAIELHLQRLIIALVGCLVENLIVVDVLAIGSRLLIITNVNVFLDKFTLLVERLESQEVVGVV